MDSGRPERIKRIYLYIIIYSFILSAGPEGLQLPAFPACPVVRLKERLEDLSGFQRVRLRLSGISSGQIKRRACGPVRDSQRVPGSVRPAAFPALCPEDLSAFRRAGPVPQCMTDLSADIRTCSDNIYYQHIPAPDPVGRCLPVLYSSLNVFPVSFRMDSGHSEQIKRIYLYIFIYSFIPSAGPEGLRLPAFRILSAFPVCPQVLPIASSHNSLISYYNPEGVSADMLR